MPLDGLVLRLQLAVDALACWLRLRPIPPLRPRRFLIIQIDGLSRSVLEHALATRRVPAIARLLASGWLTKRPMSVGLPSSTPAFQMSVMYGVHPDIPGFHYYDKRAGEDRYFPRPGVAALVEEQHARGRRGIMRGGATYGCVFAGEAADQLWTLTGLLKPTRAGWALLRVPLSAVLLGWVLVKCTVLTLLEIARAVGRFITGTAPPEPGARWLLFKIGSSIWGRQFLTLATSVALYRGVPAIYVNFMEYDVFAHGFGPASRRALRALRRVDASIAQLARIVRRLPEPGLDLYILSDHGQTLTRLFTDVTGGDTIEQVVRAALRGEPVATQARTGPRPRPRTEGGLRRQWAGVRTLARAGALQRFVNYLEQDFTRWIWSPAPDAGVSVTPAETIHVVPAGPNAFVYFTDRPEPVLAEELESRHPGVPAMLSRHPGIGLVLLRSRLGAVCWYRGSRYLLDPGSADGLYEGRADREVVLQGLRELMAMPSAGDLVLYGIDAAAGHVSFNPEHGAHAGPSEQELHTFILHPPGVALPKEPLNHPVQLYPHFTAYADGRA
jgi:Type I phosphodiesterase / nucleotide pyrophosphatase